jgi:hypothetical protein
VTAPFGVGSAVGTPSPARCHVVGVTTFSYRCGVWANELVEACGVLLRSNFGHTIAELRPTPYYVQVLMDDEYTDAEDGSPREVELEAVSSHFLVDEFKLTKAQEVQLERLGWQRPEGPCERHDRCQLEHLNWFRFEVLHDDPASAVHLVGLVAAALGVYGAGEGTPVTVSYCSSLTSKGSPCCS